MPPVVVEEGKLDKQGILSLATAHRPPLGRYYKLPQMSRSSR
jgi:hypothetical protein